jgi:hypothetical protein
LGIKKYINNRKLKITMKKSTYKKLKKEFLEDFKEAKDIAVEEGKKFHKFFSKTAESASKAFEVNVPDNRISLIGSTPNKVNFNVPVTKNRVDLVSKPNPRLKRVRGNMYWDLR